jgi:hypothetical protein
MFGHSGVWLSFQLVWEAQIRVVQASLGIMQDPISKITIAKRAGGMAQVLKHLPSKFNAPVSLKTE